MHQMHKYQCKDIRSMKRQEDSPKQTQQMIKEGITLRETDKTFDKELTKMLKEM